ncbi:MAG: DUF4352 domain-containing protein [Actinomycetota bacterium]
MRNKVALLAGISILAIAALIAGCASSDGASVKSFQVKDEVAVGKSVWKVLAVEHMKVTPSGSKATGQFVFVQAQLKNTSNDAVNLTGVELEIVSGENKIYNFDAQENNTFLTSMGKDGLMGGRVEPGETVTGWVAFDVEEAAKDLKLRVRDPDVTSSKSALVSLGF